MRSAIPIAYVENLADVIGGGPLSLLTLVRNLDRRRYVLIVICYGSGTLTDRLSASGVETHILKRGGALSTFKTIFNLTNLIKRRRIRLVHVNSLDIRGGIAARLSGVPLVGHLRVIFPFTWVDRLFARLATRVISVSDAVRDYFCDGHQGLTRKFITIPNSVSLKGIPRKTDIRAELGLPASTRLVAAVSRIDPWKGLHSFVEMAAELKRQTPGVKFLLLGSADPNDPDTLAYEKRLRRMVADLALTDDFTFLGFRNDALAIIEQLDVLVVSSLVLKTETGLKTEGFGRVIVEAMALGAPVVATRVGGIPEIIVDGESGLLVPPESPSELARAAISLLENPSFSKKIVEGGRRRFAEKYHIQSHIAQIQGLYARILKTDG